MTNHLIDAPESQPRHNSPELISNIVEEIDDVLGGSRKFLPKFGVLGGDTDGASIQMTF